MTGFGRAEVSLPPSGRAVIEIHSVNHKFLEVDCRLPEGFPGAEEQIRALVARKLRRGKVRVSLAVQALPPRQIPVTFRDDLARQYLSRLHRLQKRLGIPGPVRLETILGLPQVVSAMQRPSDPGRNWAALRKGLQEALASLLAMRRREGRRLRQILSKEEATLEALYRRIHRQVPSVERELQKRLAARIRAVAKVRPLSAEAERTAVIAEAAALVQAADVSEELARIGSHLTAMREALEGRVESPGRTIDFLAQELQREVNTLGAKVRDFSVVHGVVAMKGQIEKLREQAANVE